MYIELAAENTSKGALVSLSISSPIPPLGGGLEVRNGGAAVVSS